MTSRIVQSSYLGTKKRKTSRVKPSGAVETAPPPPRMTKPVHIALAANAWRDVLKTAEEPNDEVQIEEDPETENDTLSVGIPETDSCSESGLGSSPSSPEPDTDSVEELESDTSSLELNVPESNQIRTASDISIFDERSQTTEVEDLDEDDLETLPVKEQLTVHQPPRAPSVASIQPEDPDVAIVTPEKKADGKKKKVLLLALLVAALVAAILGCVLGMLPGKQSPVCAEGQSCVETVIELCENVPLDYQTGGTFNCENITFTHHTVRVCRLSCPWGFRQDDAGLVFCNDGSFVPIHPRVLSAFLGIGRSTNATTDILTKSLGIPNNTDSDMVAAVLARIGVTGDQPLPLVKDILRAAAVNGTFYQDSALRDGLTGLPGGQDLVNWILNMNLTVEMAKLESFDASRKPFCRRLDCNNDHGHLQAPDHGQLNCSGSRYQDTCQLTCQLGYEPTGEDSFQCTGSGYWSGLPLCNPVIDECASNPCHNNGTCSDGLHRFTCVCRPGFTGTHCETDINECASNPCLYGGTCSDGVNRYTCVCRPGFTGTHCEDIDECASNPCRNGGRCYDGVNSYTCVCRPGFTGTHCEIDIDECARNPCLNGGTCFDDVNRYTCECSPGFIGTRCETALCPTLTVTNGTITCTNSNLPGSRCTVTCNSGLKLDGSPTLACQYYGGAWSSPAPVCRAKAVCTALSLPHGTVSCSDGTNEDSSCVLTCNNGYLLAGTSERVCTFPGTWSGSTATCLGCNSAADIIFAVDVSGSVSPHLNIVSRFIELEINSIGSIGSGANQARVAFVKFKFGRQANVAIPLNNGYNKAALIAAIRSNMAGSPPTAPSAWQPVAAIGALNDQFSRLGRVGARKIGIILTDGSDSSAHEVIPQSDAIRNSGVTIICIGVANINRLTLENMASKPVNDHVFEATFSTLTTIVNSLRSRLWC